MPRKTEIKPVATQLLEQWDAMSKYITIDDSAQLKKIIQEAENIEVMSLDTETTGLDTITAECLGYSFAFKSHVAYWVPIHTDPQLKMLKSLVKSKTIIFFNAAYDLAIIKKYGVIVSEDKVRQCTMPVLIDIGISNHLRS